MQWKQRLTAPSATDKHWIKTTYGGLNECILIDSNTGSCLPNCVGYAWGRAYEAMGKRPTLSKANAENWWAYADGYSRSQTPRKGAIACWRKGQAGNASDGAGHVAFVEDVASNGVDFTSSNSGYGGTRFWVQKHYKSNGYNVGKNYYFQGFIYLPNIEFGPEPTPTPSPCDKFKIGDEVIINGPLYVSSNATSASGSVSNKKTVITRKAAGALHPYNTTGDLGWMDESCITAVAPTPVPPTPTPVTERKGLDISSYQAGISFDAIKNSEYNQFLILRGGFTGWGTGVNYNKDGYFESFYASAKAKGIPVGCYWYSCANTYDKGVAEANFLYENCLKGKQFEYPIYIDVEDTHWQVGNKDGVTAAIKGFCETLENKKFYVGIYASDISGFQEKMYLDQLTAYDKWVARYGSTPKYVTSYGMWQSSSSGRISGYGDNLDTDVAYKDYETIIKNAKLNGFDTEPQPVPPEPTPPTPPTTKFKVGDRVVVNGPLYISSVAPNPAGSVKNKVTNITRVVAGALHPYNTTGDLGWMDESSISLYNPTPSGLKYKIGDRVIINGRLYGSCYGDNPGRTVSNKETTITRALEGKPYPYNTTGDLGWMAESSIRLK